MPGSMLTVEYVKLNATVADDYFDKSHNGKPFHLGENRSRTFAIVHIPSIPSLRLRKALRTGDGNFRNPNFPKKFPTHQRLKTPCISPSPITFFECANHHRSSAAAECLQVDF